MALTLHRKSWYPLVFLALVIVAATCWFCFTGKDRPELLLSGVGAVGGFTYFLYRQHLDAAKLFKELFVEFNERYGKRNDKLNEIVSDPSKGALSDTEKASAFSYFNLCGEEYFFYKAGYIDQLVWKSWHRGMDRYFTDPRIRALWDSDSKPDSYYGFHPD